eukprot:TRINITY_DN3752_c4_g1_i1.p1 TRINITY_DN3752_c4_g1~~TRINITY_DN3752_c4_g1_i1.p1  ORF type:complete len:794 (+),score=141.31 TRINITY_DN3752_c4_g1_i1:35-2416(+)
MNEEEEGEGDDHLETASNVSRGSKVSGEGPPTPVPVGGSIRNPVEEHTPHRANLSDPGDDSSSEETQPDPQGEGRPPSAPEPVEVEEQEERLSDSPVTSSDDEPKGFFSSLMCCGKSKQNEKKKKKKRNENPHRAGSQPPSLASNPRNEDSPKKGCLSGLLCCGGKKKPEKRKVRTRHGPDRDVPEVSDAETDSEMEPLRETVVISDRCSPEQPVVYCGKKVALIDPTTSELHLIDSRERPGRALVFHSSSIWDNNPAVIAVPEKTIKIVQYATDEGSPRMYQISINSVITGRTAANDFGVDPASPRFVNLRTIAVTKQIRFSDCLDKDTYVFIPLWKGERDGETVIKRSSKEIKIDGTSHTINADTTSANSPPGRDVRWLEAMYPIPLFWESVNNNGQYKEITCDTPDYVFREFSFRETKFSIPAIDGSKARGNANRIHPKVALLLSMSMLLGKSVSDLQLVKDVVKLKPALVCSPLTELKFAFLPKLRRKEVSEAFAIPQNSFQLSTTLPRTVILAAVLVKVEFELQKPILTTIKITAGTNHATNLRTACKKAGIPSVMVDYIKTTHKLCWEDTVRLNEDQSVKATVSDKKMTVKIGDCTYNLVIPYKSCGWGSLPEGFQKSFSEGDETVAHIKGLLTHAGNDIPRQETITLRYPIKRVAYTINGNSEVDGYINVMHGWETERIQSQLCKSGVELKLKSETVSYSTISPSTVLQVTAPKYITIVAGSQAHLVRVLPSQSARSSSAKVLFADEDKLVFNQTHPKVIPSQDNTSWESLNGGEHFLVTLKRSSS